jgi:hypothetical protein
MPKLRIGHAKAGKTRPAIDGPTPSSPRPANERPHSTVATSEVASRGCRLTSPNWPGGLHPAWRGLVDWFARTPVRHGTTASTSQQPESAVWVRVESTAAGPGSGAALERAPAALPPIVPPVDPPPAATTDFHGHNHRSVDPKPPPATS